MRMRRAGDSIPGRREFLPLGLLVVSMPHQVCSRCQRANPGEAVFCYFDGIPLGHAGAFAASGMLPQEFVFRSGRRCRSFDELLQGCYQEWDEARDLLGKGEFTRFLTRAGRIDLARAAQEAQGQGDPDIALINFLRALPAVSTQQPRLELNPRRLMLGVLRIGETRQAKVTLTNSGQGILQGKISVSDGAAWLKIEGGNGRQCAIKTSRDQVVQLRVQTAGLVPQTYSARLTVITNGGIAEVPVRLDLTAVPFTQGPFKGASTPREMAEKMRKHPKAAAPLLENGEVARWFASNGWAYPVAGPPAPGVAAVQQFFECMGLSKPPPLHLSETVFNYLVVPPELQHGQVTLRTTAKKWVYAKADSDKPWLRVTTPVAGGPQQAQFAFEVDSSLMEENQIHEGTVQLIANAGQKLSVRVVVDVRRPHEPLTRRLLRPFFVVMFLFLLFRVLLVPVADVLARIVLGDAGPLPRGTLERWELPATAEDAYLKVFVLATFWIGRIVGVMVVAARGRVDRLFLRPARGSGGGTGRQRDARLSLERRRRDSAPAAAAAAVAAEILAVAVARRRRLWIVLACFCWMVLGAALGFVLTILGPLGARVVDLLGYPLAWLFRLCGLDRLAGVFSSGG